VTRAADLLARLHLSHLSVVLFLVFLLPAPGVFRLSLGLGRLFLFVVELELRRAALRLREAVGVRRALGRLEAPLRGTPLVLGLSLSLVPEVAVPDALILVLVATVKNPLRLAPELLLGA